MRFTTCISTLSVLVIPLLSLGCQSSAPTTATMSLGAPGLNQSLVLPGAQLVEAWPSEAADRLNHRRDAVLGADRLPYAPAVNAASVRVWDQQWILNGRSMDTYVRTTRSLQSQELP